MGDDCRGGEVGECGGKTSDGSVVYRSCRGVGVVSSGGGVDGYSGGGGVVVIFIEGKEEGRGGGEE